jgi:guanylate kinase
MIVNLVRNMRTTAKRTDKNNLGHCILLFLAANEIERLQKRLTMAETRGNQAIRRKITTLSLVTSYPLSFTGGDRS